MATREDARTRAQVGVLQGAFHGHPMDLDCLCCPVEDWPALEAERPELRAWRTVLLGGLVFAVAPPTFFALRLWEAGMCVLGLRARGADLTSARPPSRH